VLVGGLLGILTGFAMGWSSALDGYLHPIFALVRSIPSLALITYVMLWVGYGEAHLLIPIVFAVFTTVVIPTYHGVRDLAPVYVVAARSLGASGPLLWLRVVVPGVTPAVLSALRYAIMMAWMTAVGVEMLMGNNGMGHLLVGGGLWSGRLTIRVDPAVVIAGILGLAATGYAMDAAARLAIGRLTFWTARRRQW
jgi:ABC-type nitrate/sulfonate/bicarbonate transport system permease component